MSRPHAWHFNASRGDRCALCRSRGAAARRDDVSARRCRRRNRISDSGWAATASSPPPTTSSGTSSTVAARSDRVRIIDIGPTTDGHRTLAAIISAPENIRNLNQIRAANQRLADPRTMPPDEARRVAASHKAIVAIGGSIHASEIGATQAANELLYELTTSTDARNARRAAERRAHPDPVAEPGRPSAGRRLVPENAGHAVRRRPDAVAVSQVRRPRHQSRRVHDEHRREPEPGAVLLHRMASAGLSEHAPDGQQRPSHVRAAGGGSDRSQLRPDHLARSGAARRRDGARAAAGRAHRRRVQRDLRLLLARLRRLRAARPQHRLPADRGGQRQDRHADQRARDRAAGAERPAGLRAANQFSRSVAGRTMDASRHRRLRPERRPRSAARGRRLPRADRPELL